MTPPYLDDGDVRIWLGTAVEALANIPTGTVQTCITSPPFWGLRDYGTGTWTGGHDDCDHVERKARNDADFNERTREQYGKHSGAMAVPEGIAYRDVCGKCGAQRVDQQIGLESDPSEWVANLVAVFREVRRVLRDDGTLWLEVGDTYNTGTSAVRATSAAAEHGGWTNDNPAPRANAPGLKPKDLVGAPWLLAFALRADGWYLRSDIIWSRPNPMPESVTDRPTKAHSYIFLLTKRPRYYFDADAIREANEHPNRSGTNPSLARHTQPGNTFQSRPGHESIESNPAGRNARSVWTIATEPTPFAHFATFPQALVERCIKAGTSEHGQCPTCGSPWARQTERDPGQPADAHDSAQDVDPARKMMGRPPRHSGNGSAMWAEKGAKRTTTGWAPTCTCNAGPPIPQTVLDPFMGSGTTALVARRLGRRAVGTELSAEYLAIAAKRLQQLSLLGGAVA